MATHEQVRRCRCGTRLARDNRGTLCHACTKTARNHLIEPPRVPPEFWHTSEMRQALATCDMGVVMRAFRTRHLHGRPIPQQTAAAWVGITQTRLSRIENGEQITNLNKLARWAHVLGIPADLLWFRMPGASAPSGDAAAVTSSGLGALFDEEPHRGDTSSPDLALASDRDAMSPLSRRSLFSRGIAFALPALNPEETEHFAKALADARRYLDGDVVEYFSRQISAVMAYGRVAGAKKTMPIMLGLLGAIERNACDVKPEFRGPLLSVGAQATDQCGWLYRELREPALTTFWLDRGMEWAQEAGDTTVQGYLLLKKSQLAYDQRDALRVLTFAQAAARGPWLMPDKVRAEVAQQEALGMAMCGEPHHDVERKLDQAHQIFDAAADEQQYGLLGAFYTEHIRLAHNASCYIEAGQPARAAETYSEVLADGGLPERDAALHRARRALALAQSGEPDEAAAVAFTSVQVAKAMHSQRTLATLEEVVRILRPWRDRPAPRELREALLV
ncbi:helix-turn-helix transcriptional regulator [Saccharothrix sp. BKS2]|uniref:helix-turn-helix domain-containing protein n=1 Tax=Saccharothrix sp. BKS2 TaxID=3064400 RepID=UPI0039E89C54